MTAAHVVGSLSEAHGATSDVFLGVMGAGSAADIMVGRVERSEPPAPTDQVFVDAAAVAPLQNVDLTDVIRAERPSRVCRDLTNEPMHGNIIVHKRGINGFTSGLLERSLTILTVDTRLAGGQVEEVVYYNGYFISSTDDQPFARPGDSGAIVIDDDDCVVGMIVAVEGQGGRAEDRAFCVPITSILDALNVELVGPARHCTLVAA